MSGKGRREETGGLPRLPPGRHGLSRDFVVQNQRQRIAAGMIAVVVDRGYAAATVTQVVAAAGVSRRTFYNYYSDKAEAFFDVYAQVTDFLLEAMQEVAHSERGGWARKVRAELAALLDCFAANPALVSFTLEAPQAAGGEVAGAYRAFLAGLLEATTVGRPKRVRQPPPAAQYGAIGGLTGLVISAAAEGGAEAITALLPEVVELVLTPYLGREQAAAAAAG